MTDTAVRSVHRGRTRGKEGDLQERAMKRRKGELEEFGRWCGESLTSGYSGLAKMEIRLEVEKNGRE